MPKTNKLTDAQLRQLYFDIATHYQECANRADQSSLSMIYDELYVRVNYSLYGQLGALRLLGSEEKRKAYTVLNTFFYACPPFRNNLTLQQQLSFRHGENHLTTNDHYSGSNTYCRRNDALPIWKTLYLLNRPYAPYRRSPPPNHHQHNNTHKRPNKKQDDQDQAKAILILIALALFAVVPTFIALYYLLNEILNSVERFSYSEGWLQASLSLAGMVSGGAVAAMLASAFATGPLAGLALAAGLASPVGVMVVGIACLSIIGAAAGCFAINQIQNYIIRKTNADAIDPIDPHRFVLTDAEASVLVSKGIDPVRVKCAIVELRAQMGNKPVPSLLGRSNQGEYIQKCLDKIRQLRRGELDNVSVGCMYFDFRHQFPFLGQTQQQPAQPSPVPSSYSTGGYSNAFYRQAPPQPYQQYSMSDNPPPYVARDIPQASGWEDDSFREEQHPVPSAPPAPFGYY